jgi:hypothetical protein
MNISFNFRALALHQTRYVIYDSRHVAALPVKKKFNCHQITKMALTASGTLGVHLTSFVDTCEYDQHHNSPRTTLRSPLNATLAWWPSRALQPKLGKLGYGEQSASEHAFSYLFISWQLA